MSSTSLDRTVAEHPGTYLLTRSCTQLRVRPVTLTDGCIESRSNHDALEVERSLGFHGRDIGDEPSLMLVEADLA